MKCLIYTSNAKNEQRIKDILPCMREQNIIYSITGLLLLHDGLVIQLIEGNESDINKL